MSSSASPPRHRHLRFALISLAVVAAIGWAGYHALLSGAQKELKQQLAARGLSLERSSESWSVLGGIVLKNATLRRLDGAREPLIELSALHVGVLWGELWHRRQVATRWQSDDAVLTLTDAEGAITIAHLTLDFELRADRIKITRLNASNDPLLFVLTGEIITAADTDEPPGTFALDLKPLRAVFAAIGMKAGTGPFTIEGQMVMDLSQTPSTWKAALKGTGSKVEWRGLPLQEAAVKAQLADTGLVLAGDLKFTQGSATLAVNRDGWDNEPLLLEGTLTDGSGHSDIFKGKHLGDKGTLTIARLEGNANLLELAHNVPAIAAQLPSHVHVTTFPDLVATGFVLHTGGKETDWSLAGLQLRSPAALAVMVREHPVKIDELTGHLSYDQHTFQMEKVKGRLLGGQFALAATYDGRTLSNADISIRGVHLAELSPWVGKLRSGLDDSELSLNYRGAVCNEPIHSTGGGSLALIHTPVVHVPLLDQAYHLFPKIIPREHPEDMGEVEADFTMTKGIATIEKMKAIGQSVVVTASGKVDLNHRQVDGQARANLRGLAGVALSPVSVLLMEMKVSGPFDDISVSPLGAFGAAKTVVTGTAKLSSGVLREGLSLPFEALGMFRKDKQR